MKGQELDTQVKSKLDLTINKEDIFTVLIADKEEELKKKLDEAKEKEQNCIKAVDEARAAVVTLIAVNEGVKVEEIKSANIFTRTYTKGNEYSFKMYNLRELQNLKRPDLARNKTFIQQHNKLILCKTVHAERIIETKDGFKGTLDKVVNVQETVEIKEAVAKVNKTIKALHKQQSVMSELEYQLLTLEFDKSIKAAFLKKVVNTTDFSKLLLE